MRTLVALTLLVATAAVVQLNPPVNLALGRGALAACPERFGDWNGSDLSFENAVIEELKADDLLVRRYQRGDESVWLCVIYHQNRRYGAHDPELCYESQGYSIEPPSFVTLDDGTPASLAVNQFVADRPHERRVVDYWWTTGGLTTADVGAFRREMALRGALDNRTWGAFVRVETVIQHDDIAAATHRVGDFSARVARELPRILSGATAGRGTGR